VRVVSWAGLNRFGPDRKVVSLRFVRKARVYAWSECRSVDASASSKVRSDSQKRGCLRKEKREKD
jgi:hypothetical protein